jgi:SAM-dependent methyltransferase
MLHQRLKRLAGKLVRLLTPKTQRRLIDLERRFTELQRHSEWLEHELARHRALFDEITKNPSSAWLFINRVERMDPTVPGIFDPVRAEFHLARYRFAAAQAVGPRLADIACGTGYGTALLARQNGIEESLGIDIDQGAVDYATKRHGSTKTRFIAADGCSTGQPTAAFDTVVSFETLEHVAEPAKLLVEFHRLLKPGGRLIISIPNSWEIADAPFHQHKISSTEFARLLAPCFPMHELWAQNSGSPSKYNHGQPAGLVPLTALNQDTAECVVAVCQR